MNARIDNLYQVLTTLEAIEPNKCRENMIDYDLFINEIQHELFIQTFIVQYRKAEDFYIRRNIEGEAKLLKNVLNLIESDIITDQDLEENELLEYVTRTELTAKKITARLNNLKYKYRKVELMVV